MCFQPFNTQPMRQKKLSIGTKLMSCSEHDLVFLEFLSQQKRLGVTGGDRGSRECEAVMLAGNTAGTRGCHFLQRVTEVVEVSTRSTPAWMMVSRCGRWRCCCSSC